MAILSVENLKSKIGSLGGIAKSNRYQIVVPSLDGQGATLEIMDHLCKRMNLPGKQVLSVDRNIGTSFQKVAYGYASEDVNMSFLLTGDMTAKRYFEQWQQDAVNTTDDTYHSPGYKINYARDVLIYQLDKSGERTYGVRLLKAYPTTVSAIEYSDDAEGILELNIQLSYLRWEQIDL